MEDDHHRYDCRDLNFLALQIRKNCERHQFTMPDTSNISEKLMLVSDELSEAHEEVRSGRTEIYWTTGGQIGEQPKPDGFPIEIADAIIRLLDICAGFGIDIAEMIRLKMLYNESRPVKHGRRF